ncbi:MAG TPA: SGNH/GDSL hydrolase family protein, partial [Pirellulales bacterium]|nr:SGNH/GDSL hydrolase family protein [Pirellulales bacterium]
DEVLREVNRLLAADRFQPLSAVSQAVAEEISLPFDTPPSREEFEQRAATKGPIAVHAKVNLERLARGEKLPTSLAYRIATWQFGDALTMVFLPGEVTVDYALRLQREYLSKPLWINAYANDDPCYIASKRVLGEGGYEVDSSMYYYDKPTHFKPEIEELIVGAVHRQLPRTWEVALAGGANKWEKDIAAFEAADREHPPAPGGIVFIGSSSIRKWALDKSFPDLPVINRGFGGSHMADSVQFADRIVTPYKPRMVLVYAGDNDLAAGKTPEQVADDFKAFVAKVRPTLPDTRIVYLSVKPSPKRWSIVEKGREANKLIASWIAGSGDSRLMYVDVASCLLGDDGKPEPDDYVSDQLHLSDAGYARWAEVLRPILAAGKERQ